MREIVIIGFPKCGTSALVRAMAKEPGMHHLTAPSGSVDALFPDRSGVPAGEVALHKYPSYIMSRGHLFRLRSINNKADLVVCVRHLPKVLLSWHNMHQGIARSGRLPNHFAYQERDFFAHCSLSEYYGRRGEQLEYDRMFDELLEIWPAERVTVVAQERMARSVKAIARHIASGAPLRDGGGEAHVGYADKAPADIDAPILAALEEKDARLRGIIRESGVRAIL